MAFVSKLGAPRWYLVQIGDYFDEVIHNIGDTMAGVWRIIKTMGQPITKLTPFGGFSTETAGGLTLVMSAVFGILVSTTHTITGAIVGDSRRLTAVRWGVTRRMLWAWVRTIPGSALIGTTIYHFVKISLLRSPSSASKLSPPFVSQ